MRGSNMGHKKEDKPEKEAALLAELNLLGDMMKRHEWASFGPEEAEEEAKLESELDAEASSEDGEDEA
jgi:hypothetical protein